MDKYVPALPNFTWHKRSIGSLLFLLAALLPLNPALPHGSLHEAIERKSCQIEENPGDALLYFERGMLYQQHDAIGSALQDFHEVLRLEPGHQICHLPLAQLYRDTGAFSEALVHINRFLEYEPQNPFGYETRATIYQMTGELGPAADDLYRMAALKNEDAIRPEDYFRLADGVLLAYPGQYGKAIDVLNEGLHRLGDIISLQSRLVELEVAAQRYPEALQRIDHIMAPLARKDKWQSKRAAVLRLMEEQSASGRLQPKERGVHGKAPASGVSASTVPDPGALLPSASRLQAEVIRGPYLQMGTPTSMVIKWRTSTPTNSVVWYGNSPSNLAQIVEQGELLVDHEVLLSGLSPNTRYYYAIGNSDGMLAGSTPNHFFQTSPPVGSTRPVRAWVLGDCGTADEDARAVRDGYYTYAGSRTTDLILMLGDNAYDDGTDSEYQDAVFENMYEAQLIQSPLWSTPGNHDYGSASADNQAGPYFDIFTFPRNGEAGGLPSGTEAYYSFDYANIHFVVLDSHDSGRDPGDPMLVWLENDLSATRQEWIIAFFHHPPYSKGSHDSDDESKLIDMRENVLPILEAAGVDLVLSGHSHSYERSWFLHGHYGQSGSLEPSMILDGGNGRLDEDGAYQKNEFGPGAGRGAVYTVAGSSGKTSNGPLDHPVMYYSAKTLGSLSLEVVDKQLDLKFIGVDGEVLDYFTIRKFTPIGNPPAVEVSYPVDGAFFNAVQPITLQAEASDSDGDVEEVAFFINGDSVGVDNAAPYTLSWAPPGEGEFYVKARVRDNDGNTVFSAERAFYIGLIRACSRVNSREDDAEEEPDGDMSLSSTDLELVDDGVDQMIGMRFTGLNIPPDAIISGAWLQFSVDDTDNDDPCRLSIYGQSSSNPEPFTSAGHDISERPLTEAFVTWEPPNWEEEGAVGPGQRTPNLAPVLQEILNSDGYSAASAMVLIIQGEGRRAAESYDGQSASAPELCVEYQFCQGMEIQASSSADSICPGQAATLSAGPADRYLWSTGQTTPEITVQPTQPTTYTLTAWDERGCSATTDVTVYVLPEPQLSLSVDTVFLCPGQGQGAGVSAPAGFAQYEWSDGQSAATAVINTPGDWSLTVTNAGGCTATASLQALPAPPLNLVASSNSSVICNGESVVLSASAADSYLWSTGQTSGQATVQPEQTTTFSLTALSEYGCLETAEVTVEVQPTPQLSFGVDTVRFCPGEGMKISAPPGFADYEWSDGTLVPATFINSPGTWSLTVTNTSGCTASTALEAVEWPALVLEASSSANSICPEQSVVLSASAADSYLWSTGQTLSQITVRPQQTTTYTLIAWDMNGCRADTEVEVVVAPAPDFALEQDGSHLKITGLDSLQWYSFQWSTGETALAIVPDGPGMYCVTVTDNQGCSASGCYEFTVTGADGLAPFAGWSVFPNPFDNEVRIRPAPAGEKLQIGVFNLQGQPVAFQRRAGKEELVLEFQNLPAGVYLIVISDGEIMKAVRMAKR